jgi:hypothetical protein
MPFSESFCQHIPGQRRLDIETGSQHGAVVPAGANVARARGRNYLLVSVQSLITFGAKRTLKYFSMRLDNRIAAENRTRNRRWGASVMILTLEKLVTSVYIQRSAWHAQQIASNSLDSRSAWVVLSNMFYSLH